VTVQFTNDVKWGFAAAYGKDRLLTVSKVRHGGKWFDGDIVERTGDWARLLIHAFAPDTVSDHLSSDFHEECCRIGATYAAHFHRELATASPRDPLGDQPPLELQA